MASTSSSSEVVSDTFLTLAHQVQSFLRQSKRQFISSKSVEILCAQGSPKKTPPQTVNKRLGLRLEVKLEESLYIPRSRTQIRPVSRRLLITFLPIPQDLFEQILFFQRILHLLKIRLRLKAWWDIVLYHLLISWPQALNKAWLGY